MNKKLIFTSALAALSMLPIAALAALDIPLQPTQAAIVPRVLVNNIVSMMWLVFVGVAIVFFIIIGILFLSNMGNPEEIAKSRKALIWGGVGIGVGVVAFGMVRIVMNTLGIS